MRLQTSPSSTDAILKDFANWIIKIEDGKLGLDDGVVAEIKISDDLLILDTESPLRNMVEFTYLSLFERMRNFKIEHY